MIALDLLFITIIIVFIVDLSGFSETLKEWLSGWLTNGRIITTNYSLRPFTCSLCLTFWMGLLYLLIVGSLSIPYICLVCVMALIASTIKDILLLIKDLISKGIGSIYKYLNL